MSSTNMGYYAGGKGAPSSSAAPFMVIVTALIIVSTAAVSYLLFRMGYSFLFAAMLPALIASMLIFANSPKSYSLLIFIVGYIMVAAWVYLPSLKPGIIFDVSLCSLFFLMLANSAFGKVSWKRSMNLASLLTFMWLVYCVLEIFNLNGTIDAWMVAVRWMAVYIFVLVFFTPIQITNTKNIKVFVYTYSVLALLAVLWIFRQKFIGLNQAELTWLSDPKVRNFHVLPFGIRYWSFFTDAANAAVSLALSGTFFGVLSFFTEKKKGKYYFVAVSVLSLVASLYTGTRSHVVIPLIALIILIICSKSKKMLFWSAVIIVGSILFFRYTNIGDGNTYIWRARSAFHFERDASYLLRQDNHRKLRVLMQGKTCGAGLGMSEQKALKYNAESEIAKIPTDSWIYTVYVETGPLGVTFYVLMFLYFISYGVYISLHKLKNRFIRGVTIAATGSVAGILVASYGNGILAQFPNGIITFTLIGVIFSMRYIDEHIEEHGDGDFQNSISIDSSKIKDNDSKD
jgi:teichuronic acid biosynthesis protein TuaE